MKMNFPAGGYNFAEQISDSDSSFPFYPVRNKETIHDSTHDAFYTRKLLEAFNEPNISLRPSSEPVIRIIYKEWTKPAYFITIQKDRIQIKKGLRVDYLHKDEERLSGQEQKHLNVLERGVPVSRRISEASPAHKRNLDSLVKLFPELLDNGYYHYLMQKAFVPLDKPFTYSTTTIPIQQAVFYSIINKLAIAGYWTLPIELGCNNTPTDGYGLVLEVNSGTKYNVVKFGMCLDEPTPFRIFCKQLIEFAGLQEDVRL